MLLSSLSYKNRVTGKRSNKQQLTSTLTNSVPRLLVDRNIRLSLVPGLAFNFRAISVKYSLVIGLGTGATSRLRLDNVDDDDHDDHDDVIFHDVTEYCE